MSRIAYVNGAYVPHGQAVVHVEDRGFQFADGVYEVWSVFDGRLADFDGHMTRLVRSLTELRIDVPMTRDALTRVLKETVRRNRVRNGIVYLQVTRGTARRDHPFPPQGTPPSVIVTARSISAVKAEAQADRGVAVITQPDIRWGRCDIKTVGLRTRDTQANILRGITRAAVLDLVAGEKIELDERPFSVDEAKRAREAFFTAAGAFVMPAISIDGTTIGDGTPGPVTRKLRTLYLEQARREAI